MTLAALEDCITQIGRLVAFPTVSRDTNRDLIDYAEALLAPLGFRCETIWNDTGDKANLWASIGPEGVPGVILSGHSDVVPVDGQIWTSDPFVLRRENGRLYGRGAADMKGFVGLLLAIAPALARRSLRTPVHFAISYDEELGCTGVTSLTRRISGLAVRPALCIVGEPTLMELVIGHKGGGMYRVAVTGSAAHSSLAPLAVNAIEVSADLVAELRAISAELAEGPHDHAYDVPHSTLSVTTISGGNALNIIPDRCEFTFDIRALPAVEGETLVDRLRARASEILTTLRRRAPGADIVIEQLAEFVPLDTAADHPAVTFMKHLLGRNDHSKVAYGTEAGLFSRMAGVPAVVCGPGSISQAHKPDEFIALDQIEAGLAFLERLVAVLESERLGWAEGGTR